MGIPRRYLLRGIKKGGGIGELVLEGKDQLQGGDPSDDVLSLRAYPEGR